MLAVVTMGVVLALGACVPVPPAPGSPSGAGCGKPATTGLVQKKQLLSGGVVRDYLLTVPPTYNPNVKTPLVFNFHGFGSSAIEEALYTQLDVKGAARGFIVVTPNGIDKQWDFTAPSVDFTYTADLVRYLDSVLCVDRAHMYTTGISNGAAFSSAVVCQTDIGFAAFASVSGLLPACANGVKEPVLAFHGTADPIVPYNGGAYFSGVNARRTAGIQAKPVDDAVANWARFDGCGTPATTTAVAGDVEHVTYPDCPPSGTVELYRVVGGGHTWPGAIPIARLGPTTSSIDASALMLAFFDAHPRTG
jgi:polyhydroxybutyrate depolymerase